MEKREGKGILDGRWSGGCGLRFSLAGWLVRHVSFRARMISHGSCRGSLGVITHGLQKEMFGGSKATSCFCWWKECDNAGVNNLHSLCQATMSSYPNQELNPASPTHCVSNIKKPELRVEAIS